MTKQKIAYFEEIDFDSDNFFNKEIILDDLNININLDFSVVESRQDNITEYEKYIDKIDEYKTKIDKAIIKDYKDEETTLEYLELNIEELDDITTQKLLEKTDPEKTEIERLLSILKLDSINFRFIEDEFALWNYTIGSDVTDYFLTVYTDKKGKVVSFGINR